jgi:hypothetical protein
VSDSIFTVERSNYSIHEYIVHHSYISTVMMNIVVTMTTMTILMTFCATKNYLIQRSLTDANFVMVIF